MPDQTPHVASRRRILAGIGAAVGAVIAVPAIIAATGSQAAASQPEASERARTTTPECLSDLVAMGVVTDADFVAR